MSISHKINHEIQKNNQALECRAVSSCKNFSEVKPESHLKPKPMIEIGGMPILWHVMKSYSYYGYNEFIICCGYKSYVIKQYFADYYLHRSDITFDFSKENSMIIHNNFAEPWKVTVVDTGLYTMTGGRVKRIKQYVGNESFMLTYGDGVCDVNINNLVDYHNKNSKIATMTAIQPDGRFGVLDIDGTGIINSFREKSKTDSGWINGGYMVLEPEIFDYIDGDDTVFEKEPLEAVANKGQLVAYMHHGFWQCMDTQRDRENLEKLIASKNAPWMKW